MIRLEFTYYLKLKQERQKIYNFYSIFPIVFRFVSDLYWSIKNMFCEVHCMGFVGWWLLRHGSVFQCYTVLITVCYCLLHTHYYRPTRHLFRIRNIHVPVIVILLKCLLHSCISGNRTHNLGIASVVLYCLSHRKTWSKFWQSEKITLSSRQREISAELGFYFFNNRYSSPLSGASHTSLKMMWKEMNECFCHWWLSHHHYCG